MLLASVQLKLDQTLLELESALNKIPDAVAAGIPATNPQGASRAKVTASAADERWTMGMEAHEDFTSIRDLSLQSEDVSKYKMKDNTACSIVVGELDAIDERHRLAALASLEGTCGGADDFLLQKFDVYADAMEELVSSFQSDLLKERQQMALTERSCTLIEASVQAKYERTRDGYITLTRQLHKESREQFSALMTVPRKHMQWHLDRLNSTFGAHRLSEELQQKRLALNTTIDHSFSRLCEQAFRRLAASTAYEETERYQSRFSAARQEVLNWKSNLTFACEEQLNHAEIGLDSLYMSSVEEIDDRLFVLQESLHKLAVYERKLDHLLLLGQSRQSSFNERHVENTKMIVELARGTRGTDESAIRPAMLGSMVLSLTAACDLSAECSFDVLQSLLDGASC